MRANALALRNPTIGGLQMKTLIIALALTLAPTLSVAMGCNHSKTAQIMSCGDGTTYDADAKTCMPVSS
jgi:hypothetical protein